MSVQGSIVIGGGAFAGLALALALRQGLGPDIPVIVADPALATRPSRDPRATAIVAACRRLFEAIGAWDDVRGDAQPILDMVVTDSRLEDATRPVFLNFAGDVAPGEPFAHMVENRRLIDALVVRAEAEGIDLRATAVTSYDARSEGIDVTLGDGSVLAESLASTHNAFLYVFEGALSVLGGQDDGAVTIEAGNLAVLGAGEGVHIAGGGASNRFLLVAGKQLNEPVARAGPFVMNTRQEVMDAFQDFREGRF